MSKGEVLNLKLLGAFSDDKIYELINVFGSEGVSQPFSYKLDIFTREKSIMEKIKCNTPVSFKIESMFDDKPKNTKIFNGIIGSVSAKKRHNTKDSSAVQYEYKLELVPKFLTLDKVAHSRVFYQEGQEITKIVEKVLGEHKIKYDLQIKDSSLFISESCIQYNESDYSFVSRLLQSMGCYYYFKHDEKDHTMVISNQISQYYDLPNKSVQYVTDGGEILELNDFALNYSYQPNKFTVNAFVYTKPTENVEKSHTIVSHGKQEGNLLDNETSSYLCNMQNPKQIEKIAEVLGAADQSSSESLTGQSRYLEFTTGGKFKLEGKFFTDFPKKDYVITKLSFSASGNGGIYLNNFTSIPDKVLCAAEYIFQKPLISGIHFAVVVNADGKVSDDKPHSDKDGKIFIKLLWGQKNSICKANVLSISNGYSIPRVGSMVYVLFPNNDLYGDTPVVCGLHNQGLLKFDDEEEKYKNFYMTYPASDDKAIYNSISFTDKKEAQAINIDAKKDLFLKVEHDEVNVINNDSTSTIKNIRKVVLTEGNDILEVNKGDISIESKEGKYKLTTKGDIIIESQSKINITSKADFGIKSGGKITMEAKGDIIIKADGEIKGNSKKDMSLASNAGMNIDGNTTNIKSKTSANYKSGTSTAINSGTSMDIKSTTTTSIQGTSSEVKGAASLKLSSAMTKIGM